jgi:hypothetical protein
MWTRVDLKNNAKIFLKKFYGQAFLVALVIAIVTSGGSSNGGGKSNNQGLNPPVNGFEFNIPFDQNNAIIVDGITQNSGPFEQAVSRFMPGTWALMFGFGAFIIMVIITLMLSFRIFVGAPLEVGGRKFFVKGAQSDDEVHFAHLGMAFRQDHYLNIVWAMFYRGFMNFLFYLLLIIPGIIKSYGYSMVPYLLADNPNLDANRALKISEDMTNGQKFDMFVLDLSFIGWYLLGSLAFGIGVFFVNPYAYATKAQLYLVLKRNALQEGLLNESELVPAGGFYQG